MKVSTIMASFLGAFNGQDVSERRDKKFIRAVNSFLKQTYEDKELIIVSDGCERTNKIYEENWKTNPIIKLFSSPKQVMYSGGIRSIGCKMSNNADIITYLDNDDVLGKDHIKTMMEQWDTEKYHWVYYDDLMVLNKEFTKFQIRLVEPRFGSIGTSSISHINYNKDLRYKDRTNKPDWFLNNGYGHDFQYTMHLAAKGGPFKKLENMSDVNNAYIVCHYASGDF